MRQGIWPVKLKGIRRQKRGDKVIRYHRATGIRLPDDIPETHPDFVAAWARCEAGQGQPEERKVAAPSGSLAAACIAFRGSPTFTQQSPVYRDILTRNIEAIRAEYGHVAIKAIKAKHISADLAKLAGTRPLSRLKTWRKVMDHARRIGLIEEDPSLTVKAPKVKLKGHEVWTEGDIETFRKKWKIGTVQRACFELLLWTAARTVDAVRIGPQHVGKDGVLSFRQSKTGGMAYVPWTAPLPSWGAGWTDERREMMEALRCLAGGLTFLQARGARPRSEKGLSNLISAAAREAKLEGRTAHGLRKARLTRIAEAGGSAHAIKSWGGHKTLAEAAHYTESADAKRLVTGTEQEQNSVSLAERDTKTGNN